jgi:hypothetical protein
MLVFTFLCADTLPGAVPTTQAPQLSEVGRIELPVPPVELLTWQTEHTVVAVTFLWAETPLGAVPTVHVPQLSEVRRITIVLPVEPPVPPVEPLTWQTEQTVVGVTFLCAEMAGADPIAQAPQLFEVAFMISVPPVAPPPLV